MRKGDPSIDDVLAALRRAAERDGVEDVDAVVAQFATFVRAQAPHLASAPRRHGSGSRSGGGARTLALLGSAAVIAGLVAGVGTGRIANPLRSTTSATADASDGTSDDAPLPVGVTPNLGQGGGTAGSGATGVPAPGGVGDGGAVHPLESGGETLIEIGADDVVDSPVAAMTFSDPDAVVLDQGSAGPTDAAPVSPAAPAMTSPAVTSPAVTSPGDTTAPATTTTTTATTATTTTTATTATTTTVPSPTTTVPSPTTTAPLQESPAAPLADPPAGPPAATAAPAAPAAPAARDDGTGGDPA
jgi:hypothetical protein